MSQFDNYTNAANNFVDVMDNSPMAIADGSIATYEINSSNDVGYLVTNLEKIEIQYKTTIVRVYTKAGELVAALPTKNLIDNSDLTGSLSTVRNTLIACFGFYGPLNIRIYQGVVHPNRMLPQNVPVQVPTNESVDFGNMTILENISGKADDTSRERFSKFNTIDTGTDVSKARKILLEASKRGICGFYAGDKVILNESI